MRMHGSFKVFALFWNNCCGSEQCALFLPFLGKMLWIHLSSNCLQCLKNFELRAERLALADMTAVLLGT